MIALLKNPFFINTKSTTIILRIFSNPSRVPTADSLGFYVRSTFFKPHNIAMSFKNGQAKSNYPHKISIILPKKTTNNIINHQIRPIMTCLINKRLIYSPIRFRKFITNEKLEHNIPPRGIQTIEREKNGYKSGP